MNNKWLVDGSLVYRLNEKGYNVDQINVSQSDDSFQACERGFAAVKLAEILNFADRNLTDDCLLQDHLMNRYEVGTNEDGAFGVYYGNTPEEAMKACLSDGIYVEGVWTTLKDCGIPASSLVYNLLVTQQLLCNTDAVTRNEQCYKRGYIMQLEKLKVGQKIHGMVSGINCTGVITGFNNNLMYEPWPMVRWGQFSNSYMTDPYNIWYILEDVE